MDSQKTSSDDFKHELHRLVEDLRQMALLTESGLERAAKGLFDRQEDACLAVIADDEAIDQLEKQIDQEGVALLTRFQPSAVDLRQVISAMKVSSNLERVADQAVNIARKARKLRTQPPLPEANLIQPIFDQALHLFRDSVEAYLKGNATTARTLKARDKTLDAHHGEVKSVLTDAMGRQPVRIADYLNLLLISHHLERVGDHATNIAEDTVYMASGQDVRHQGE